MASPAKPLTDEETGPEITRWLAEALEKIGRDELDESVHTVLCRNGILRFEVRVTRREDV